MQVRKQSEMHYRKDIHKLIRKPWQDEELKEIFTEEKNEVVITRAQLKKYGD